MTYQSMWRRAYAGVKIAAVSAVVAGAIAFSAPVQAVTITGDHFFGGQDLVQSDFDQNTTAIEIALGDYWSIDIHSSDNQPETHYLYLEAQSDLKALTITSVTPNTGFVDLEMGWFDNLSDMTNNLLWSDVTSDDFTLSTSIAALNTKYLAWRWDGVNTAGTLDTHLSAVPLPPALLLFLSGLAGIGFLGRVKAKRRERVLAAA